MKSDLDNFSLKHRVFLVKYYYQFTGDYLCVKTKYEDNYRDSENFPAFSYDALMDIVSMFERTGSVFDLPERASGSSSRPIEGIFVKQESELHVVEEQDALSLPQNASHDRSAQQADSDDDMWDPDEDFPETRSKRQSKNDDAEILKSMKKNIKSKMFCKRENSNAWTPKSSQTLEMTEASGQENSTVSTLDSSVDKKLDGISRKLDNVLRLLKAPVHRTHVNLGSVVLADPDDSCNLNVGFPVSSKEELEALNTKLGNPEYKATFVRELSRINGFSGTCEGLRAAYRLCDYIFDRKLMNAYSWTGLSKKSVGKDRFNQYTNVIEAFGEVVTLADSRFSNVDNEDFFKLKILKHSEARAKKMKRFDTDSMQMDSFQGTSSFGAQGIV